MRMRQPEKPKKEKLLYMDQCMNDVVNEHRTEVVNWSILVGIPAKRCYGLSMVLDSVLFFFNLLTSI